MLTIWPGDTVHTTTVDAGGADEKGVTRVLGGNPQTGPFFVQSAMPGDVLAVRFDRIRLNRDYAVSDDGIVGRALGPQFAVKMKDVGKTMRWHLDREKGVATSQVAWRPLVGLHRSAPADARLCRSRAGIRRSALPDRRFRPLRRQHGSQRVLEGVTVYLPCLSPARCSISATAMPPRETGN